MKDTEYPEKKEGMTITNECYYCMIVSAQDEDYKCRSCVEDREWKDDDIAREIVDEGNLQYKNPWHTVTQPSGHDWVSSVSVVREIRDTDDEVIDHVLRLEYAPPIVQLIDGGVYEELWELEDYTQRMREVQCKWCNILTPKMFNDCQSCDKPLENNLV